VSAAIDILVLLIAAFYGYHGWRRGFLLIFLELSVFGISLAGAFALHRPVAAVLSSVVGLAEVIAKPLSLLGLWLVLESAGIVLVRRVAKALPDEVQGAAVNRAAGAAVSVLQSVVLVALLMTLCVVAPVPGLPRQPILKSVSGAVLVDQATRAERFLARLLGDAVLDSFTFLTVRPHTGERVKLRFATADIKPSPQAEAELLALVNGERVRRGLPVLKMDERLRTAARAHSADMQIRGYFSHMSLDGRSPFDRMRAAGVEFRAAGENLAFAPTVKMVHRGLMSSPGHRANILNPEYRRVGIGVQDAGVFGLMVTQDFAD